MEGKESVDAKTPAQDDRFIRAVEKRVQELSSRQRKSAWVFYPFLRLF